MLPAKIEPIQPLALERSLKTLSLPEWLLRSVSALTVGSEVVIRGDGVEARRPIATITRSLAPSPACYSSIEARALDLQEALEATDVDVAMAKVTELLMSFATQALSDAGAKARARGYITALEDLPAWAIAEACRRWLRHEAGENHNYNFAPSPPVLRKIAEGPVAAVEGQMRALNRLLFAKVVDDPAEFSDEYRAEMLEKLKDVFSFKAVKAGGVTRGPDNTLPEAAE